MLKKLLLSGAVTGLIAVAAIAAPSACANYYDCNGNMHYGTPEYGECHYLVTPPSRSQSRERTPNTLVPSERQSEPETNRRDSVKVLEPQPRDTSYRETSRDSVNVLEPQRREEQKSEGRYEIRNARKYCVRDYCYYVYDYCDELGNCVKKQKRYENPNYNPYENDETDSHEDSYDRGNTYDYSKTWNYWVNQYINNYYYQHSKPEYCYPGSGRCIYRGFHFGGYHNGYWYW